MGQRKNSKPKALKILKKKTRRSKYEKVDNSLRQKLIDLVCFSNILLKDAASILGINYSTAKTILRIFRTEKRISKKNSHFELFEEKKTLENPENNINEKIFEVEKIKKFPNNFNTNVCRQCDTNIDLVDSEKNLEKTKNQELFYKFFFDSLKNLKNNVNNLINIPLFNIENFNFTETEIPIFLNLLNEINKYSNMLECKFEIYNNNANYLNKLLYLFNCLKNR